MSEKTKPLAARTDSFRNVPGPNSAENPIATNADIVKAETAAEVADSAAKLDDGVAKLNINENEAILAPVDKHDAPVDEKPKFAAPTTPLTKLFAELPAITTEAGHSEMWGVQLSDESDVPSSIVLEKFLRANTKDVEKAKAQLIQALKWRKSIDPAKLLADVRFDPAKFGGVGYVTTYAEGKEIVSWNIYGAVKDKKATFGNVEEFINWRSALMELSVQKLDLASATEKIPADGVDQYRMVQVHDYLSVSFFKMDPAVKAASKEVIATFSMAYPELLKEKFFVNVPVLMGWVSAAMKLFLSAETIKKFHPLTYGSALAGELSFGKELPTPYGGNGKPDLTDGLTVKYAANSVSDPKAVAPTAVAAVVPVVPAEKQNVVLPGTEPKNIGA